MQFGPTNVGLGPLADLVTMGGKQTFAAVQVFMGVTPDIAELIHGCLLSYQWIRLSLGWHVTMGTTVGGVGLSNIRLSRLGSWMMGQS